MKNMEIERIKKQKVAIRENRLQKFSRILSNRYKLQVRVRPMSTALTDMSKI